MTQSLEDQIAELRVEIAAQRLTTRAVLAFVLTHQKLPLSGLVAVLQQACEQMAPAHRQVAGMDYEVQEAAHKLVVERAAHFIRDLGDLAAATAPPSRSGRTGPTG